MQENIKSKQKVQNNLTDFLYQVCGHQYWLQVHCILQYHHNLKSIWDVAEKQDALEQSRHHICLIEKNSN